MEPDQILLCRDVSELCIGKPPVRPLPATATVGDALRALKRTAEPCLSVWTTDGKSCIGKVSMADVICYLCSDENLAVPAAALMAPLSALLPPPSSSTVGVVQRNSSVLEALDMMLDGAENLVVPIRGGATGAERKKFAGAGAPAEYCWLTLEDFVRYFLNNIAHFSPILSLSVADLNLIRPVAAACRRDAALSVVPRLRVAASNHSSVPIIDDAGRIVGDISPSVLSHCDETTAAAVVALSAGELISYLNCYSRNSSLVSLLRARLQEKKLEGMLELLQEDFSPPFSSTSSSSSSSGSSGSSSSSDEEPPVEQRRRLGRRKSGSFYYLECATLCSSKSSLMAVMVQAVAHRVGYLWVVDDGEQYKLVGEVLFYDIVRVIRDHLLGGEV